MALPLFNISIENHKNLWWLSWKIGHSYDRISEIYCDNQEEWNGC